MPPSAAAADSDSDSEPGLDIFTEPADFRPPDKPATNVQHTLVTGAKETLNLRLIGQSPLWGHLLWNAGRATSEYLERHAADLVHGKTVLELGAGAGLPSLVCALRGASKVIATDYPDPDLIANLAANLAPAPTATALGYIWGQDPSPLLQQLLPLPLQPAKFDLLVLSDLLFNHSQHAALADTVGRTLAPGGTALVFFTPHRPWLYLRDMEFFDVLRAAGMGVRCVLEQKGEPMFEEDPGDREMRRMVFGYEVRWGEV